MGITGPSGSGKTTVWRAIGGGGAQEIATVDVPDARLDEMVRMHSSPKRVPIHIEIVDVHQPGRTPAAAIAALREMDAILLVVAAFGGLDASTALTSTVEELVIADLAPLEKRLERARKDKDSAEEIPVLEKALARLSGGEILSGEPWEESDLAVLAPLAPLTIKPLVVVVNVDESVSSSFEGPSERALILNAQLESEVAGMEATEARTLLEAYGVSETGREKVVRAVFESFDLITFYTMNAGETRAWELRRGSAAPDAAGTVHTDMRRGFIRAEAASFDEVARAGSWDAAKAKGLVRVEGKEYAVRDGDVLRIRFAV